MEKILRLLSSPIWGGIQGILAMLALLTILKGPARWIRDHSTTRWVSAVPWVLLFVVSGLAAGLGTWLRYQDLYRGAFVAAITISIGLTIQWLQSQRSERLALNRLRKKKADYSQLLRALQRIVQLQEGSQTDYKTDDRRIIHHVAEDGGGLLREELTLTPITSPVYFHVVRYSFPPNGTDRAVEIEVSAESVTYKGPLTVLELERSASSGRYAIAVDPPGTAELPHRIALECKRTNLWSSLLANGEDDGFFGISYPANSVSVEFIAPPGKKWKSFRPTAFVGKFNIESIMNSSKIIWNISNPPIRRYDYKVVLEQ